MPPDSQKLAGNPSLSLSPVHPIMRCPIDILKCIFEACFETPNLSYKTFSTSASISQVCRHWRAISLDTPRIWSIIDIECSKPTSFSCLQEFWERTYTRIKQVPAYILIRSISTSSKFPYQGIQLDKIPVIEHLMFNVVHDDDYEVLLESLFPMPIGILHTLSVDGCQMSSFGIPINWNVGRLLCRLPQISKLEMTCVPSMHMQNLVFDSIHTLIIAFAEEINPIAVLTSVPRVKSVKMHSISDFKTSNVACIRMAHLTSLMISGRNPEDFLWLAQISCPILEEFEVGCKERHVEPILSFISVHSTISTLDYRAAWINIVDLETVAPQIRNLSLPYNIDTVVALCKGHFLHLRSFKFYDITDTIPEFELEELIRSRCLPFNHPQSQISGSISPLQGLKLHSTDTEAEIWSTTFDKIGGFVKEATHYEFDSETCTHSISWI